MLKPTKAGQNRMRTLSLTAVVALLAMVALLASPVEAETPQKKVVKPAASKVAAKKTATRKPATGAAKKPKAKVAATTSGKKTSIRRRPTRNARAAAQPKFPTYGNPAEGDDISRDDPVVRAAAVQALGKLMGGMVVVNPENGQILSIVNQRLALASGYQPCSSFKPAVALAALGEGIINNDSNRIQLGRKWTLDLQDALAKSNNLYFESLGRALGLERLQHYARLFGFGEQAAIGLGEESKGAVPEQAPPKWAGGVGKVASFGQGISMTTLQLASFTSALANGGRLFYLQYPIPDEPFEPRLKRELPISDSLNPVRIGMESAVLAGTARRANIPDVHLMGKTGTCSEDGARLGWFAGYTDAPSKLAVVVLLRTGVKLGGGPKASEVAGRFFRNLGEQNYYATRVDQSLSARVVTPVTLGTLR